jgi:hypothetical protein
MINQREFDKVYTVRYILAAQGTVAVNVKKYFTGFPFLRYIKPKAISINNTNIANDAYLNISDAKGNYCLFNYPMSDLYLTDDYPKAKLRLVNIEGIDLLNSYWIYAGNTPFSAVAETTLFTLSFYY